MAQDEEMKILLDKIDDYFIHYPNASGVSILEGELCGIDSLLYTLKGEGVIGLFNAVDVPTSNNKNALQDSLYMFDVDKKAFEKFKKEIYNDSKNKFEIKFDKELSILKIGRKTIKITLKTDKPNEHYILEYIFENEEGLKAKSYYTEIIENKFPRSNVNNFSLRRACISLNAKVSNQANITNFLIFKSGKTGFAQINPEYL